jgi:hypothetical protein
MRSTLSRPYTQPSDADAQVDLYRAVRGEELISIHAGRRFENPEELGMEVKYFATSLEDAHRFADTAGASYEDGPYMIARTRIEDEFVTDEMRLLVDGGLDTVVLTTVRLNYVGRLQPGYAGDVTVTFLQPGMARNHSAVGKKFTLKEGRIIGTGVIKQLLF